MSKELFYNAELSQAAYATLVAGVLDSQQQEDALFAEDITESQFNSIAARYTQIVNQYNSPETGFSVTAFRSVGGGISLAFRGTESDSLNDFAADVQLAGKGAAIDQIISMYNWWMRVSTVPGENVLVPQFQRLDYLDGDEEQPPSGSTFLYSEPHGPNDARFHYLVPADAAAPFSLQQGNIGEELHSDTQAKVNVTGHSLGGHLALAFHALFGTFVNEGYAFNAPGIDNNGVTQNLFEGLGGTVPTAASANFTQVIANETSDGSPPFTATAGLHFTSSQLNAVIHIAIEDQNPGESGFPNIDGNHSIQTLTDALAVYALLTELDSTLSADDFYDIFQQSSNQTFDSLENIVSSIASLFGVSGTALVPGNDHRNDLYLKIADIRADTGFQQAAAQNSGFAFFREGNTAETAKSDFGHFFALEHLTPFVFTANDEFLQQLEPALYDEGSPRLLAA